jgi:hypothetical protein
MTALIIPLRMLQAWPLASLYKLALAIAADIDAGADDKLGMLDVVFRAIREHVPQQAVR